MTTEMADAGNEKQLQRVRELSDAFTGRFGADSYDPWIVGYIGTICRERTLSALPSESESRDPRPSLPVGGSDVVGLVRDFFARVRYLCPNGRDWSVKRSKRFKAPAETIIAYRNDSIAPFEAAQQLARTRGASIVTLSGDHHSAIEDPEVVTCVVLTLSNSAHQNCAAS